MKRLIIILMLLALPATAATHYIRAGATNENNFQVEVTTTTSPQDFILAFTDPSSFKVEWGNNVTNTYTYSGYQTNTNSYATAGTYTVKMYGQVGLIDFFVLPHPGQGTPFLITNVKTPILGVTGLSSCMCMFKHSWQLTNLPNHFLDYVPSVTSFYDFTINCSNLLTLSANMFVHQTNIVNMYGLFSDCDKFTTARKAWFDAAPNNLNLSYAFVECDGLTNVEAGVFDSQTRVTTMAGTFNLCRNLVTLPPLIFDKCVSVTSYWHCFAGDSKLTGESPTNHLGQHLWELSPVPDGTGCFTGCTLLTDYASIPADWK